MKRIFCIATSAFSLLLASNQAIAVETLLFDDFTVTSNSQDVNQELAGRQTGSLAVAPDYFTYSANGTQHQVGNPETDVGQPGGVSNSDYLLLAFNSNFYSDLDIGAGLANGEPLTISFDMYISGNPNGADADDWGAFTLRSPGDGWPVAGSGEFGMLKRNDGRIQMFQNSSADEAAWDVNGYSTDPHWELTFSDSAGTGSAFDGNGSMMSYTNGANSGTVTLNQLNSSGLRLGFRNFDNMFIGIDNLEIVGAEQALFGDANDDDVVDILDFYVISDNFYTTPSTAGAVDSGDINADGFVDQKDFRAWRIAFGSDPSEAIGDFTTNVPEPASAVLLGLISLVGFVTVRKFR